METVSHPIFARVYERLSVTMDRAGGAEHRRHLVAVQPGVLRRVQRIADATLWPKLFAGCRTGRDTPTAIAAAGFDIEELHRFRFPATGPSSPAAPHIRGTATRPSEGSTP